MFQEVGHRRGELISLVHLGQVADYNGDNQRARDHFQQALSIAREIADQETEGECELRLGQLAFTNGDSVDAELWLKRSLTLCREAADRRGEANALRWLGKLELLTGALDSARLRLTEALGAYRRFEMWDELLGCLEDFAELCQREGMAARSLELSAAVQRARDKLGLKRPPREQASQESLVQNYRLAMTGEIPDETWRAGLGWEIEDAVRAALESREGFVPVA